jgi:hypothetical protein
MIGRALLFALLLPAALVAVSPDSQVPALETDSSVTLILKDGVGRPSASERESWDLELELHLWQGSWQEELWAYAVTYNRADHPGRIVKVRGDAKAAVLEIELDIRADRWSRAGRANYRVDLRREGARYTGEYTGNFAGREVGGQVSGSAGPLWWRPLPNFKEVHKGEHPRLIFRKSERDEIRRRAQTPEGKAIIRRLHDVLDKEAARPKLRSMPAAGYGLAYQITGDVRYAARARRALEETVLADFEGLVQDIHYGPYALGAAIAFDFCYDAWDDGFRSSMVDWLANRIGELEAGMVEGKSMSGFNPNPWSNHNAIRVAAAGTAALAILKEDGTDTEKLEKLVYYAARDIRRHFLYGLGETGWFMEGEFYKKMTWNAGPGHFAQAYRKVTGGDMLAERTGAFTILGEWMETPPSDSAPAFEVGDGQTSGLWPAGLVTVPPEYRPAVRWLYDRTFGLKGDRTFGIGWAYEAAYVLANYPFDSPAQPPGLVLPWAAPDFRKGHWIFRRPWRDAGDTLLVLHLNSESWRGCHYERIGETGALRLWALGKSWLSGVSLIDAGISNSFLGGETTFFEADDNGKAQLTIRLDDYYLEEAPRGVDPDREWGRAQGREVVTFRRAPRPYLDHGIRGAKSLLLDLSGRCGAPVLLVMADRVTGAASPVWRLGLAESTGPVKIQGNTFRVEDASGVNLQGVLLGDAELQLSGRISASGARQYLAVVTVQEGPAPEVTFHGSLPGVRITVGGLTLRWEGDRFHAGEK